MTTVITRLYADTKTANAAVADLKSAGFTGDMMDVVKPGPNAEDAMAAAQVSNAAAAKYAAQLSGNAALVVARAPFMPMGAAFRAMEVVDAHPSLNAGVADQNAYVKQDVDRSKFRSKVAGHGHILGHDLTPGYSERYGLVTAAFGLKHLKPHRSKRSAISGGGFKSRMFWPMPLLKKKDGSSSAISGGAHMSKLFWPMPLISRSGGRANVS